MRIISSWQMRWLANIKVSIKDVCVVGKFMTNLRRWINWEKYDFVE